MPYYRLTYTDFQGSTRQKVSKAYAAHQVRSKARLIPDCRNIGEVTEISEDEFKRAQEAQRRHPHVLNNRRRRVLP